jgi:hypothetical protein
MIFSVLLHKEIPGKKNETPTNIKNITLHIKSYTKADI